MATANTAITKLRMHPIKSRASSKKILSNILVYTILIIWACTTIFPLLWVGNNSLRSSQEILTSSLSIAKSFNFENFVRVMTYDRLDKNFLNSMIISCSVIVFTLILGGFAAFALSRLRFGGKNFIHAFLFAGMLVPQFALIVPVFRMLNQFKLNVTHFGLIIPQTAGFLAFAVITLVGFMSTIPVELEEAAVIEGCSIPKVFFKIIYPISKPAFATAAIMVFLWSYNDLLLSQIYLSKKELQPICVVLSKVSSMYSVNYGAMMAAIVITIAPVLILYVISQEYVIKGMTAGAVKG